jgi:DNA-binding response OmpR family regulator
MHILVVEDERLLADQIARGLRENRHVVDLVSDGPSAVAHATTQAYDLLVLDVMLPGIDGYAVCRQVRAAGVRTPILMLTARREVRDRVEGLDAGADDYLTKPFAFAEFLARIRALERREPGLRLGPLQAGDLILDPITHKVERAGQPIHLTPREYAILEYLLRHRGQVLSRDQIAASAWELGAEHASNVVDVFIRNLRRKIDDQHTIKLLHTVRGAGYAIRVP